MSSTFRGGNQRGKTRSTRSASGSTKRDRCRDDEGWGGFKDYMAAKKYKLDEQFDKNEKGHSNIFHGLSIYINGYTKPSSDELRRLITAHGGKNEMYLSKMKVTHIVATTLPNSKFHLAKSMPVVKPEWITESVSAGRCLPHTSYLTISNKSKLQPGLKSLPSVSSLSRISSTCSFSSNGLSGCNDPQSIQSPHNRDSNTENSNKHEYDAKGQEEGRIPNEKDDIETPISSGTSIFTKNDAVLTDDGEKNRDCPENGVINGIETGEELDLDIVYNSEDEDTPQKFQQHFSRLSRRPRSLNSPDHLILPDFHIGKNNTSTPKIRNCSDRQSVTELKGSNVVSTAVSPIQEENNTEDTDIDSLSTTVTLAKVSPSKLVSPPKPSIAKAGDKGFLNEYYSNSRLHHIATWGAEFKAYVADIQQQGDSSFPGRKQLRDTVVESAVRLGMLETLESSSHGRVERTVMHVDMDCFFVSVGLLSRPDFKGKPVAVTHSRGQGVKPDPKSDAELEKRLWNLKKDKGLKTGPGSSCEKPARNQYDFAVPEGSTGFKTFHSMAEIASCSYEARKTGVKNGMMMGRAKTLCPDLLTIPYDFDEYNRVSRILYDIIASFTHDIEAVSCDELFVDCTDILSDTGATALDFARLLRKEVFDRTGCHASVGIGPNILLARLATKKAKPNGVFQVFKQEGKAFIKDQNVSDLPGVGYSMSNKLARLGVATCGDLQSVPQSTLRREFGPKTGESLHRFSLGVDDREVKGNKQRKSVSAEVNYGIRFTQESDAFKFLRELSGEVAKRLDGLGVKGRSITLKLMVKRPDAPAESAKFMGHGICNTMTKSTILPLATSDGNQIGQEIIIMYKQHKISAADVRGIGIQVQRLEDARGRMGHSSHNNAGAHQSILHFAVGRKALSDSSTAASSVPSRESEITGTKFDKFCSNEAPLSHNAVASLRSKDSLHGISDAESDAYTMRDVSFLLSPSQVSESVLEELPADIVQEIRTGIERHRKGRHRPSHTGTLSLSDNETASGPSTSSDIAHPPSTSSNPCDDVAVPRELPSQSQLDMSCFRALPRSLQKELEEAYAKQKQTNNMEEKQADEIKCDQNESSPYKGQELVNGIGHDKKIPDPSSHTRTSSIILDSRTSSAPSSSSNMHDDVVNGVNDLPSESQIDMSCFHALPKSLQKELKEAYAKQKQTNKIEEKRASPIKGTALAMLKSPTKDKGKQLKKRRGRPPGSKKGLNSGNMTKLKSLGTKLRQQGDSSKQRNVMTDERDMVPMVNGVICVDDDDSRDDGSVESRFAMVDQRGQDLIESTHIICRPKVEFCGASSVKDVRNLFKEWVESCAEPGDSDVAMVTDHLTSLVHHKCLEQAFCLLRFLRRYVQMPSKSVIWKQCADMIAALVQSVVVEVHGTEFKLG